MRPLTTVTISAPTTPPSNPSSNPISELPNFTASNAFCEQVANFLEKHFRLRRRRRRRRNGRRRLFEPVDALDGDEQDQCDDDEIENSLEESPVLDQHVLADRIFAESDGQVREIESADEFTERRHEDVADQRGDDFSEGRADDHTDR